MAERVMDNPVLKVFRWTEPITPHPRSYGAGFWTHCLFAATRRVLEGCGYGQYRLQGAVKIDGAFAARRVTLLRRRDFSLVAQTWSDPDTGEYAFEHVANEDYCVICDDHGRSYNAAVADWVEPELME